MNVNQLMSIRELSYMTENTQTRDLPVLERTVSVHVHPDEKARYVKDATFLEMSLSRFCRTIMRMGYARIDEHPEEFLKMLI